MTELIPLQRILHQLLTESKTVDRRELSFINVFWL